MGFQAISDRAADNGCDSRNCVVETGVMANRSLSVGINMPKSMWQGKPITLKQARLQALYVGEKAEKRRYGMKPITQWTLEEKNHFLTLLMGKCWHEFEPLSMVCKKCGRLSKFNVPIHPDYFTDSVFAPVKRFMEKELPEVWNQYLYETHGNVWLSTKGWKRYDVILNAMLDLTNLITFLLDNQEGWAWKECTACTGNGNISENSIRWGVDKITCPECQGAGKVKHPALLFAEGVK